MELLSFPGRASKYGANVSCNIFKASVKLKVVGYKADIVFTSLTQNWHS